MIKLDGSYCEGGGQILRTALALSAFTGQSFEVDNIRKGRHSSGLKNQHLYCIKALQQLCNGKAEGVALGSHEVKFTPGKIEGKEIIIDIGTAGSMTLLLQSVLLPTLFADKKVVLKIKGGTDNKWAMPYDYFKEILLPHLMDLADIKVELVKRGYYPRGGGEIKIEINPKYKLKDFRDLNELLDSLEKKQKYNLIDQGSLLKIKGVSHASSSLKDAEVAERQAKSAEDKLKQLNVPVEIKTEYHQTLSPGTGIVLYAIFNKENIRIGADSLGERGKKSEKVGKEAADKLINEINYKAPVDEYLADNLIPFLALCKGKIKVAKISNHTLTNIYVVEKFLGKTFKIDKKNKIIQTV
jgi:RNA 3'-terminal phosphate cyclase (GTP)